ncbi:MAG TPA: transglutaminase domain-containing protein, partial [Armatimonadota bacterium]
DMPAGKFVTGGEAWKRCRDGQADPDTFGIFDMRGWDFIRGDLLRDFLSFSKVEVLPWDFWGLLAEKSVAESSPAELAYLDRLAELAISGDSAFEALRAEYDRNPALQVPAEWSK